MLFALIDTAVSGRYRRVSFLQHNSTTIYLSKKALILMWDIPAMEVNCQNI